MPGLLLSLGPGSTMAPKPLLCGTVGSLWLGVSFCEVHICFLSLVHDNDWLQLQGRNTPSVMRTIQLDAGNMDACLLTAHISPDWGGVGSAGGCCLRSGAEKE